MSKVNLNAFFFTANISKSSIEYGYLRPNWKCAYPCGYAHMQWQMHKSVLCCFQRVSTLFGGWPTPSTTNMEAKKGEGWQSERTGERCEHGSQWIYFMTQRVCLDLSALHAVGTCSRSHPLLTPNHTNMHIDLAWWVYAHGQKCADLLSHKQICTHPSLLLTLSWIVLRKPLSLSGLGPNTLAGCQK